MMPFAVSLILCVSAAAGGGDSRAVTKQLKAARMAYYEGRAADALPMWDKLLAKKSLSDAQRHEVMRFKAFTLFVLNRRDDAAEAWKALLALTPDAHVDPNEASPEFVEFFNALRPQPPPPAEPTKEPEPEPDSEPDSEPSSAPAPAEPAPSAAPAPPVDPTPPVGPTPTEEITASPTEVTHLTAPEPELTTEERGCGIVLCLIPFGVGQFANGSWIKGVLFAALQAGGLATNIGMYWAQSERVPPGEAYLIGQHVALGVFGAALLTGILDAFLFP